MDAIKEYRAAAINCISFISQKYGSLAEYLNHFPEGAIINLSNLNFSVYFGIPAAVFHC